MLGESEMDRGALYLNFTSRRGGPKEGRFETSKSRERARSITGNPGFTKDLFKDGGLSKPTRNGRTSRCPSGFAAKRESHGKMVRERGSDTRARANDKARRVVGDTDERGENGMNTDEKGRKNGRDEKN